MFNLEVKFKMLLHFKTDFKYFYLVLGNIKAGMASIPASVFQPCCCTVWSDSWTLSVSNVNTSSNFRWCLAKEISHISLTSKFFSLCIWGEEYRPVCVCACVCVCVCVCTPTHMLTHTHAHICVCKGAKAYVEIRTQSLGLSFRSSQHDFFFGTGITVEPFYLQ